MRLEVARLAVPRRSRRPERTVLRVSRTKICRSASCCASAGRISAPAVLPDRESSARATRVANFDAGASPATPRDPAPTSSTVSASTFSPRRSKSLRLSTGCEASSVSRSASRVSHTRRSDSELGTSVECPTWKAEKPSDHARTRHAASQRRPTVRTCQSTRMGKGYHDAACASRLLRGYPFGGAVSVVSAGSPWRSSRDRSASALTSAPTSSARELSQSQVSMTITIAREPQVLS